VLPCAPSVLLCVKDFDLDFPREMLLGNYS
jgi:hypothetical protein